MKKLGYQIQINAPAEKVWNCMLQPVTYQQWTQVSWPGSLYEGKWEEGEKIRFISANGSGMLAIIKKLTPYQYLSAEHMAVLLPVEEPPCYRLKSLPTRPAKTCSMMAGLKRLTN